MERRRRVRHLISCAKRRNALGGARNTEMDKIRAEYNISTAGVGGTRVRGIFYTDGDYWNA